VPVAEKLGVIRLVNRRVLELVLAELAASPDVQLRLNISPDTTMDPDWWASIGLLLHAHPGCPNGSLSKSRRGWRSRMSTLCAASSRD
jgi:EAL domain-containing protein (putative c-di-GMP-specific phosphodiesterase class I)